MTEGSPFEPITRREREILQLISEGLSDQEIANRLFLTRGTVKWHTKNIYGKFGVERRTQAVKLAREQGLLDAPLPMAETAEMKLPHDTTSFVDRRSETERILSLLASPDCRLLTLVGVGGIGKTRLAIQAARRAPTLFRHGKVFIPLVGVGSVQSLATTIAATLEYSFFGADKPEVQLLRYLSRKSMLLLLDNYEQLLPDVGLITTLLARAPGVKLLVTSRERLNLREEWVFQVDGLSLNDGQDPAEIVPDASTLFVQRALQINPAFQRAGMDMPFVQDVCRQVEGIPLAIELAAGWARSLTAQEIAQEIGKSFQLLTTTLSNVPERHRSMQIVFEETWARMTEREQRVIETLSVFRGGFTRDAAAQVAGADLPLLTTLHDKSLITLHGTGRYALHELLRQFAAMKLAANPQLQAAAQEAHTRYFAQYLWDNRYAAINAQHRPAIVAIQTDYDNIRQAWQRIIRNRDWQGFALAWEMMHTFCQLTAQYHESEMQLDLVLNLPKPPNDDADYAYARGVALALSAFNLFMTSRVEQGLRYIAEAFDIIERHGFDDIRLRLYAHHSYTCLLWAIGSYDDALQQADIVQSLVTESAETYYLQLTLFDHGIVYLGMGDLQKSRQYFNRLSMTDAPMGRAWSSNFLGEIAETSDDLQQAEALFTESLSRFRVLEMPWGVLSSLINLGRVTYKNGARREGAACLYEALDLAIEIQAPQTIVGTLAEIAYLCPDVGQVRLGIAILDFLRANATSWTGYNGRIEPYLAQLKQRAQDEDDEKPPLFATLDQVIERVQAARPLFRQLT